MRSVVVLTLVATFAAPATALGQPIPEAARADFERGTRELEAQRFAAAIAALDASYRAAPHPLVLFNLGLAHRGLGHVGAAIDAFDRYLREDADRCPPARCAAVRTAIGELRAEQCTVTVEVTPADATFEADGRALPLVGGAATLDPGEHVLVLRARGFAPWQRTTLLAPGSRETLHVNLTSLPAETPPPTRAAAPLPDPPAVTRAAPSPHPRAPAPDAPGRGLLQQWWFWTVLSVVVVGGVTAGIVYATRSPEPTVTGVAFDVQALDAR